MAILKHYSVHNSNYHDAVLYLTYQHDNHARPVYDEHGLMIERENLLIDGINTDVFSYGYDCARVSRRYGKNRSASEIKSHHPPAAETQPAGQTKRPCQRAGTETRKKQGRHHTMERE